MPVAHLQKVVTAVACCPAIGVIVPVLGSGRPSYPRSSWVEAERVVPSGADPQLSG